MTATGGGEGDCLRIIFLKGNYRGEQPKRVSLPQSTFTCIAKLPSPHIPSSSFFPSFFLSCSFFLPSTCFSFFPH